jgi:two-component system, OmpR family, sensor kinase
MAAGTTGSDKTRNVMIKRLISGTRDIFDSLASLSGWMLALLPAALGFTAYLILHAVYLPVKVPMLVFKADLGSALAVLGVVISLPILAWVSAYDLAKKKGERALLTERAEHTAERRRFLRRLDHELKNPLTGLRAALANLAGTEDARESTRIRADAQLQAERLSRLVGDLRKLAELEERPIEHSRVNLAEVLEETVQAACSHPAYSRRAVRMVVSHVPWPLSPVTGDRDLLGLVFYNLIENALKYSGPAETVEVRAADDGRWVTVEVADTGPGISSEDLPRLFEELYRGSNARGIEGSGLGLALVRRVIDRHGGQISIRSRQDGVRGTVVTVRLLQK